MKIKTNYVAILFLSLCLSITSCSNNEEIVIENDTTEVGYLNINALLEKEINVTTTDKPPTLDAILDDLTVEIYLYDIGGQYDLYSTSNYRDLPATIGLPSGNYNLQMYSSTFPTNVGNVRVDNPDYGWIGGFDILPGNNTVIDATLNLLDTAVTIDFTDEVLIQYPDIIAYASVPYPVYGVQSISWSDLEDNRTVYFNMSVLEPSGLGYDWIFPSPSTLLVEVVVGSVYVTRSYNDVRPNEHYRITVSYSGDSSATINVTLGNETIIEDEIPFPG